MRHLCAVIPEQLGLHKLIFQTLVHGILTKRPLLEGEGKGGDDGGRKGEVEMRVDAKVRWR